MIKTIGQNLFAGAYKYKLSTIFRTYDLLYAENIFIKLHYSIKRLFKRFSNKQMKRSIL